MLARVGFDDGMVAENLQGFQCDNLAILVIGWWIGHAAQLAQDVQRIHHTHPIGIQRILVNQVEPGTHKEVLSCIDAKGGSI